MDISKMQVEKYLSDIFTAMNSGNYQISSRDKNQELFINYLFSEADAIKTVLSLTTDDFSKAVFNDHPHHKEEILYIFGKNIKLIPRYGGCERIVPIYIKFNKLENHFVIIISFHEQEFPLTYRFK